MSSWLAVAVFAPLCWALVNLIDVYFVDKIYRDEWDGTIVSALAQGVLWATVPFVGFQFPGWGAMTLALTGGVLYVLSSFFYFRSLKEGGDAAATEVLFNLTSPMVAMIAFAFLGERLTWWQIVGIGIVVAGGSLLAIRRGEYKGAPTMLAAMFCLAVSMVVEKGAYEGADFWSVYLTFSLGAFLSAFAFLRARRNAYEGEGLWPGIWEMSRKSGWVFLVAEGLAVLGITASQRAIDLAPSPAFVAAIEALQPAFIVVLSAPLLFRERTRKMARDQMGNPVTKIIATMIMVFGIYLIGS